MKISRRCVVAAAGALIPTMPVPAFAGKTKYVYDALGRVTGALYADGALAVYEYDAAGNRIVFKNPYVGPTITSDCFDAQYYLRSNPDVAAAGVDPYTHFMSYGWVENRNPSSFFNTEGYKNAYNITTNPLYHYVNTGWIQNKDPSGLFGTYEYLDANLDVKTAGMNPLFHYLTYGYAEGRDPKGDGQYRP
ncbi:RHS repeat domain-containing protein [Niveispirillum sp. KHB5.9]|uniref:RHS repeat domain-containing protein n=1 Tax=Niveispirillum sp. KHB5.9 TaxID=3400269 RepID=UPI003A8977BC